MANDRKSLRKAIELYNVDAVTALATQMKVLIMKMDNLSKSINMVLQLLPNCKGCGVDHATIRCPSAYIHVNQLEEASYSQNF